MPPIGDYALIGGIAAVCSYLLTFVFRRLAARMSFVAEPDERHLHHHAIPYGGGPAMFLAFLAAMIVADHVGHLSGIFQGSSEPLGVVLGAAVILGVGLLDDAREISAPAKVAGQVLAAMFLVFLGATMFWLKIPLAGTVVLSPDLTPLITALWVIGITNAINLIDGLDGLAAGIVAIASGALSVYGVRLVELGVLQSSNLGPLIAVITCGVCIGFLPHNFNPARVFMGDAGALFLGLLMAAATMEIGGRTEGVSGQTYFFYAPLFLPLFILGVPIADMAFAYVRRMAKGTSIDTPDNDHVHHRLVRLGHGPRRTVVILWTWTAALSGFVLFPLFTRESNGIIPFVAIILGLLLFTWFRPGLRNDRKRRGARRAPKPRPEPQRGCGQRRGLGPPRSSGLRQETVLCQAATRHDGSEPGPTTPEQGRRPSSINSAAAGGSLGSACGPVFQKSRSESSGTVRSALARASSQRRRSTRLLGSMTALGRSLAAASSRFAQVPTATPAKYAAPSVVASMMAEVSTGRPMTFASAWVKVRFALMPPSTRRDPIERPESVSAASRRSAPRWAIPSSTARTTSALPDPRVSPSNVPRAP